jgi:aspartyl-tRNA(Asn)/glutamyl-tRNA(Gln) amidotransferase subunit A
MTKLTDLSVLAAIEGLKKKKFSATELTQAHITAMEHCRPLNVFITETPDRALADAKASDARYASGTARMLDGIPVGVKDNFCTTGILTTAASNILHNFVPPYESTVTQRWWDAGAVCMGKINMDEFAMGTASNTGHKGPVINPWTGADPANANRKLTAGGTSGGSVAATAARCVMGALGSDTGGSIRQPAALTSTVGLKPTYGRSSRFGVIAFASSLDCPAVCARDVRDTALLFQAYAGHDANDSTSVNVPVQDYMKALTGPEAGNVKGLRVGVPKEYRIDGADPVIMQNWDNGIKLLREAGAEIVDVSLPMTKYGVAAYYIVAPAECSSNLARFDGVRYGLRVPGKDLAEQYENTRGAGFNKEVRRRIMVGTYALSSGYYDAYYLQAQKVRRIIFDDFKKAFEKCDVMLTPTSPSLPFGLNEKMDDPIQLYLEDVFTIPVSMAGLPAVSVPGGLSAKEGLPMGLQIIGKHFDEATILNVALALEQAVVAQNGGPLPKPPFCA